MLKKIMQLKLRMMATTNLMGVWHAIGYCSRFHLCTDFNAGVMHKYWYI